jgi:hypothetical protein
MSGLGCLVASARDAATPVAVAPTLDARSQVSPSVRAMTYSYFRIAMTASDLRSGESSSVSGNSRP